jgi:hypothetical protein
MPLPDLTKPPSGSMYRMLPLGQFGFGLTETNTVVIVDWVVTQGDGTEFQPLQLKRHETHRKYGIFEKYTWKDGPVEQGK